MVREDVSFKSGTTECAAWLYRPESAAGSSSAREPLPMVVMAHGFSATRELRLDAYAQRFCDGGLGVLLFDYRHFGSSGGEPRQLLDIRAQLADYLAAIAHARRLDWVDEDRIAVFGSSFSGGHVIAVAASDSRIAAAVSQCPFTDGLASLRTIPPLNLAKLSLAGLRDQLGALAGRPPRYVPAVGPPGSLAVMTTPDSQPGFERLLPPQHHWENRVAARIALRVATYRPGAQAARVTCPILFCICDQDSVAPASRSAALAARAPRADIKRYPVGHFDIYVGEMWERAVADQTDFLVSHLLPKQ